MKWRGVVELAGADGTVQSDEVSVGGCGTIDHSAETLRLTLAEGKKTLAGLQRHLVQARGTHAPIYGRPMVMNRVASGKPPCSRHGDRILRLEQTARRQIRAAPGNPGALADRDNLSPRPRRQPRRRPLAYPLQSRRVCATAQLCLQYP